MKKLIVIAVMGLVVVFLSSAMALSSMNWPNPHSQYDASTDFCLQCHDIHEAGGDYALMYKDTVVNVCGTCHGVYQQSPSGARQPSYGGTMIPPSGGTAASRTVYKIPIAQRYTHEGHRLGQLGSGNTTFTYAGGDANGNDPYYYTTTTADWIPGSGGTLLTRIPSWTYYYGGGYIDPASYPASGRTALNGLYCASCHSPHGTVFGNAITWRLLSRRPNHIPDPDTTETLDTTMSPSVDGTSYPWATNFTQAGGKWCIKCHKRRWENGTPDGQKPHTHPARFCINGCHGNNTSTTTVDFPHTGAINLLSMYPDALCLQCHTAGKLP